MSCRELVHGNGKKGEEGKNSREKQQEANGKLKDYLRQIGIETTRRLRRGRNWDVVLGGKLQEVLSALEAIEELGHAPRGDDRHTRVECSPSQFEPNLT